MVYESRVVWESGLKALSSHIELLLDTVHFAFGKEALAVLNKHGGARGVRARAWVLLMWPFIVSLSSNVDFILQVP